MIRYALNMDIPALKEAFSYKDAWVFSGSCFSEHMVKRLEELQLDVFAQPNGVVFNPLSLAEAFKRILEHRDYEESDLIEHEGLWHSKYHHGSFSEIDKNETLKKINHSLHELRRFLGKAKVLSVTFGSAYVYTLKESGEIVANCHKIPQKAFEKRLLSVSEITEIWKGIIKGLKDRFPALRFLFTVSPVRHLRDGVHENNLSKSTLMLAINELQTDKDILYFPAYELLVDDLRDYRFFDSDGAHPNQAAIDHVFDKFRACVFDVEAQNYISELDAYLKMSRHRLMKTDGEDYLRFMRQLEDERNKLTARYDIVL